MKKILWLPSWYPNRTDPFDGDFIQRHAMAAALFCKIHVIHLVKENKRDGGVETVFRTNENLTEQVIYYTSPATGFKPLDRFLSRRKYIRQYRKAIAAYITSHGKPALMHVHVALKAGPVALRASQKWKLPFIVSEHWTGYLPEADIRFEDLSLIYRRFLKQTFLHASDITVVSDHLGRSLKKHFPSCAYRVIPNTLDDRIFHPVAKKTSPTLKLIHISNMRFQKNCEAILKALQLLKQQLPDFTMDIYGSADTQFLDMINDLDLREKVFLKGEVPQSILAEAIQRSDALVLYSRFETFGCVVIEANACGVPAIVSDIAVFHELIKDNVNGIFVKEDDPGTLAKIIFDFNLRKDTFDADMVSATTGKYHYKAVGEQFNAVYGNFE